MKSTAIPLLALLGSVVIGVACSAGGGTGDAFGSGGGNGLSGAGGGLGQGGGLGVGGGGKGCETHCSADLHQVVDCKDRVLKTCPDDMACGKGGNCVAPCQGAADNASTFGCDFFALPPSPETGTNGSCFAVLLANNWTTPVTITADYNGTPLDVATAARTPSGTGASLTYQPLPNGKLPPGEVGIVFLTSTGTSGGDHIACPSPAGLAQDVQVPGTGLGAAFHVTTDAPVVAYDMFPYGGAQSHISSATLLIPTPAWGKNYVAADAYETDPSLITYGGVPFVQIVGSVDGTKVTINPVAAVAGGTGVPAAAAGSPLTLTLNRGQMVQFAQSAELAGSPIESDKPVGVWGGTGCMYVPLGVQACDAGHQQLFPVQTLGHEFVAVRYRDRGAGANESVPWTFIGAVDGTALTYDPAPPAGAPTSLAKGQMVRFSTGDPFSVKSADAEHPFYVAGHMTGCLGANPNPGCMGDPEYVTTIPAAQWLPYYLFLTDPTYGNSNLVFIRKKNKAGTFDDVNLDCVGNITGWQPVGAGGEYEYTRADLVVSGANQGSCANGVHTAKSATPFALTVWGWDYAVSYAYPAGMSTQTINNVVVPATPK